MELLLKFDNTTQTNVITDSFNPCFNGIAVKITGSNCKRETVCVFQSLF